MDRAVRALKVLLITALAAGTAGCGSGSRTTGGDTTGNAGELRRHEETFRPSEFDPPPAVMLKEKPVAGTDTSTYPPVVPVESPAEQIAGFRVQIFSSTDIDEANGMKTSAEQRFPGEWFYLVYEPPAYKVRAGDFQQRYDADRFAKALREGGYGDSWVVPDRVLKTRPPKPPVPVDTKEPPK
jgi:hypothetical protein